MTALPWFGNGRGWPALKAIEDNLASWRKVPVQILWGMQDWCFHGDILKVWESLLPEAEVRRFEDAGHYLLEDAGPEVLGSIRDFADSP